MVNIFNLEIRKNGDFRSIFKDVDSILAKHGMVSGQTSIKVAKEAVAHSLQNMLKRNYFDVCTINNCSEASLIKISSARRAIYHTAHCIHWGDMTLDYKEQLIAMVMDDFRTLFEPQLNKE